MTQKFYAIVTNLGAAKIANAVSLGTKLNITQMAVGDGGGALPTPNASQTKLVNEVRRAALNSLTVDENNSSQIIAEQVIPETEGGFWIREMGLFDADGTLIAVCNTAETYKPQLQEGSGRTQRLRMMIIVSSTDAVTLKVDPAVVLATRQYVDDAVIEVKAYADGVMENHVKSANPHTQYPLIGNALKEMADAGLLPDVLKNLGLTEKFSGRFIDRRFFTTPGSISYKPTKGTKRIKIILTGGGARGYGFLAWGSNFTSRGGGGGAGGTVIAWLDVDDTKTYAGVVGRGGDDTVTPTSSTFNAVLTAGNGTSPSTGSDGGKGGLAVGGDLNIQGGDGSDAPGLISDTTNVYRGGSGDGGVSYWGGGIRSGEKATTGRQEGFGSGGGGATRSNPFVGNFGCHGVIYIEEYS